MKFQASNKLASCELALGSNVHCVTSLACQLKLVKRNNWSRKPVCRCNFLKYVFGNIIWNSSSIISLIDCMMILIPQITFLLPVINFIQIIIKIVAYHRRNKRHRNLVMLNTLTVSLIQIIDNVINCIVALLSLPISKAKSNKLHQIIRFLQMNR